MKKLLVFVIPLALFTAETVKAQVNFVRTTPSMSIFLTDSADVDTLFLAFPKSLTSSIAFDTSKANRTAIIPPQDFVSAQGKFTMYLTREAVTGTADSFRVWVKKVMPSTGIPVRNDSTFIIGTATTFADIINYSQYPFTITDPTKGLAFGFFIGNTSDTIKVKLNCWIDFTQ